MTKNKENQNCQYMARRIGSTTYKVKVVFLDGGEKMEEKILRMICKAGLQKVGERGMMDAPQFCGPNCRAKYYRQEAVAGRSRECVCGNCGKEFTTTRSDVKYCCEACQREAHRKTRKEREPQN